MILYNYRRQAWIVDGRYLPCAHLFACACFGRRHVGERAPVHLGGSCTLAYGIHAADDCPLAPQLDRSRQR